MKSKVLLLIYIAVIAVLLYFAYGVAKDRYFSEETEDDSPTLFEKNYQEESADKAGVDSEEPAEDMEETSSIERDANGKPQLNRSDCENECVDFKNNESNFEYCQKICGFIQIEKKESKGECENLSGSKKDFCLRDVAVTKKDFDICEEIEDSEIKEACQNRITEELLDENSIISDQLNE